MRNNNIKSHTITKWQKKNRRKEVHNNRSFNVRKKIFFFLVTKWQKKIVKMIIMVYE